MGSDRLTCFSCRRAVSCVCAAFCHFHHVLAASNRPLRTAAAAAVALSLASGLQLSPKAASWAISETCPPRRHSGETEGNRVGKPKGIAVEKTERSHGQTEGNRGHARSRSARSFPTNRFPTTKLLDQYTSAGRRRAHAYRDQLPVGVLRPLRSCPCLGRGFLRFHPRGNFSLDLFRSSFTT